MNVWKCSINNRQLLCGFPLVVVYNKFNVFKVVILFIHTPHFTYMCFEFSLEFIVLAHIYYMKMLIKLRTGVWKWRKLTLQTHINVMEIRLNSAWLSVLLLIVIYRIAEIVIVFYRWNYKTTILQNYYCTSHNHKTCY